MLVCVLALLAALCQGTELRRLQFEEIMRGVSQRKRFVVYFAKQEP